MAPRTLQPQRPDHVRRRLRRSPTRPQYQLRRRVLDREGRRRPAAQLPDLADRRQAHQGPGVRPLVVEGFGKGVSIGEGAVAVTGVGVADLAMGLPQPKGRAARPAVEVVLQIEAQRPQGAGPPHVDAEAGGGGVQIGVAGVAAADRNGRRDQLVGIARRTEVVDGVNLGEAAQLHHRLGAGNGNEAAQLRIIGRRRRVRPRHAGQFVAHGVAGRQVCRPGARPSRRRHARR
ncbi:hypothetical protein D3C87_1021680 [compost metagenome]